MSQPRPEEMGPFAHDIWEPWEGGESLAQGQIL